jgi:hypothetical protein
MGYSPGLGKNSAGIKSIVSSFLEKQRMSQTQQSPGGLKEQSQQQIGPNSEFMKQQKI